MDKAGKNNFIKEPADFPKQYFEEVVVSINFSKLNSKILREICSLRIDHD